jgi:hypothetical protein
MEFMALKNSVDYLLKKDGFRIKHPAVVFCLNGSFIRQQTDF